MTPTPEERAEAVATDLQDHLEGYKRGEDVDLDDLDEPDLLRKLIADAIRAAVAEEREAHAELLAAADDAIETFEQGGMPGGPILRLRSAIATIRARRGS